MRSSASGQQKRTSRRFKRSPSRIAHPTALEAVIKFQEKHVVRTLTLLVTAMTAVLWMSIAAEEFTTRVRVSINLTHVMLHVLPDGREKPTTGDHDARAILVALGVGYPCAGERDNDCHWSEAERREGSCRRKQERLSWFILSRRCTCIPRL